MNGTIVSFEFNLDLECELLQANNLNSKLIIEIINDRNLSKEYRTSNISCIKY